MKKLLALILCVMMFVSVLSTSAFAAHDPIDQRTWKDNAKVVEALRKNIENMYGSLAVDNVVFDSLKGIDSIITGLVDEMLKDYAPNRVGMNTPSGTLNDAIVAGLRSTIGGEITDYIDKHRNEFYTYDALGQSIFNPAAYAGVYAKAASNALTSKKAVAGIQAYMLFAAQRSAFNSLALQANDLFNAVTAWNHMGDYGFDSANYVNGAAALRAWNVPGVNLDGVLHNIAATYQEALSALGQLGVDVNRDGLFDLGFDGNVLTVDNTWVGSNASESETINTPLTATVKTDGDKDGNWESLLTVYEGNSATRYVNGNDNNIFDPTNEPLTDTVTYTPAGFPK